MSAGTIVCILSPKNSHSVISSYLPCVSLSPHLKFSGLCVYVSVCGYVCGCIVVGVHLHGGVNVKSTGETAQWVVFSVQA